MSPRTLTFALVLFAAPAFAADPPEPKFRAVTIDDKIQIGYGVAVADVDGDGKPDVLLADKKQFVWYRNPGADQASDPAAWSKFILAENLTEKDNVCLAAEDLDGDGKCEIAVGAEWNPGDTEKSGAVFYLIPPADRTQRWEPVKFPSVEPTTHRMKWLQLGGTNEWGLVVVPLHGRGNKNGEGAPVKVLCYIKPADVRAEWKAEVVDESMHMTHNFSARRWEETRKSQIIIGGKEGIAFHSRTNDPDNVTQLDFLDGRESALWTRNQLIPAEGGGSGEVRFAYLAAPMRGTPIIATVEPMHGHQLVVYSLAIGRSGWQRTVLTDQLSEGHALAIEDVIGGRPQIIVGWRGNAQKPQRVGIKLFTPLDTYGEKWRESLIDDNGMACEDLVLADLNADGKLDIVASGRATKNVKIYFNETLR